MSTLYELTGAMAGISEALANGEDVQEALDAVKGDFAEKVENCVKIIRNLEAEALAINSEIGKLATRSAARERSAKWLRNYLCVNMRATGTERVKGTIASAWLQTNPEKVVVTDPDSIPEEFWRVIPAKREPDKAAMLTALHDTGELPAGVKIEQGETVHIR